MKIEINVIEITKDDLVTLLSDANYGSHWMSFDYDMDDYRNLGTDKNDCFEDRLARILLSGGKIRMMDTNSKNENDFYGSVPHGWDGDLMVYDVSLEDIKVGIKKAFEKGGFERKSAERFLDRENLFFDVTDAENLCQMAMFGEVVY